MAALSCGIPMVFASQRGMEAIFLDWDVYSLLLKAPFLLGLITAGLVYYWHRKEKPLRQETVNGERE